jgi:hypothetical protein
MNGFQAPGAAPERLTKLTIFTPLSQPVLEKLREVDLNRLTPLEALNLLGGAEERNLTAEPRSAPRTAGNENGTG